MHVHTLLAKFYMRRSCPYESICLSRTRVAVGRRNQRKQSNQRKRIEGSPLREYRNMDMSAQSAVQGASSICQVKRPDLYKEFGELRSLGFPIVQAQLCSASTLSSLEGAAMRAAANGNKSVAVKICTSSGVTNLLCLLSLRRGFTVNDRDVTS